MAKYDGVYSCGHEGTVNICGPTKDREWKKERIFSGLCPECYKKKLEADRERKNQEAAEISKEMEYPLLSGTEKQIAWANTLRIEAIKKIDELAKEIGDIVGTSKDIDGNEYTISANVLLECADFAISEHTDAKFWIEKRELSVKKLVLYLLKEIKNKMPECIKEEIIAEKERLTIKPENGNKSGVVHIEQNDMTIVARYIKDYDFMKIVKEKNMEWTGVWKRKINECSGPIDDRIAELGNALLAEGFTVSFPSEKTKDMAISGEFTWEQTRWIKWNEQSEKLAILWDSRNDTLYEAARKLPGAKWNSGCMKVPIEFYAEVQDFAENMGFSFSKTAQEKINIQIQKEALYETEKVTKAEKAQGDEKLKKILKSSGTIIEDLKDDVE